MLRNQQSLIYFFSFDRNQQKHSFVLFSTSVNLFYFRKLIVLCVVCKSVHLLTHYINKRLGIRRVVYKIYKKSVCIIYTLVRYVVKNIYISVLSSCHVILEFLLYFFLYIHKGHNTHRSMLIKG